MRTGVFYRWAHPGCNEIKSNRPFLDMDWKPPEDDDEWLTMKSEGFPILDDTNYVNDATKFVLNCLGGHIPPGESDGGSKSKTWRDEFCDPSEKKIGKLKSGQSTHPDNF